MEVKYQILESIDSLRANATRSALSIIGVVFGVASVVAMLAIGLGAESEVENLLSSLGEQNLHLTQKTFTNDEWNKVIAQSVGLTNRDVLRMQTMYPASTIARVAKWEVDEASLPLPNPKLTVLGADPALVEVLGMRFSKGHMFNDAENFMARPVVVLGSAIGQSWFGNSGAVGKWVRIGRSWFQVVGVLEPVGAAVKSKGPDQADSATKLMDLTNSVVVPFRSGQTRMGPLPVLGTLDRVIVKLPEKSDSVGARASTEAALLQLHRGAKTVDVMSADEIIAQKRAATRLFSYFLLTVSVISLVVGGIGIANVMLASMVERIREVGLRRAIGARRSHIKWQFLTEALFICALGGVIGGLTGGGVSIVIGAVTGWKVLFPWWGLLVALAIATAVGALSGLYPALKASRVSPIEALQGRS